jgi:hypothetical protein
MINLHKAPHAKKPKGQGSKNIALLKKKLIFSSVFIVAIAALIGLSSLYEQGFNDKKSAKIKKIEEESQDLEKKSAEITLKIKNAKKYKEIWNNADAKRKNFNPPKLIAIGKLSQDIADEFKITNPQADLSSDIELNQGIYKNRQALTTYLSEIKLTFNALTDKDALGFIEKLTDSLPGYVIISKIALKKSEEGKYSNERLMNISKGDFSGIIEGNVEFSWYFTRKKNKDKKEDAKK